MEHGTRADGDAYVRLEISLENGWQAIAEIHEAMAKKDLLRDEWRRTSGEFVRTATEFLDALQEGAESRIRDRHGE